jgi:bifunctional DNase/RNase
MDSLGGTLEKVVLLQSGELFSAQIVIIKKKQAVVLNCGAGDALALALRCNAPVFIDDASLCNNQANSELNQQELRSHIAHTDTLEFGRYYL